MARGGPLRVAAVETGPEVGAVGQGPGCGGVGAVCSTILGVPLSPVHPVTQSGQPWGQGSPGVAASVVACCPDLWAPGGLVQPPGVPGSLVGSGGAKQGQGLGLGPLPAAPCSAVAVGASPAVLEKSSGWLAVRGYLCPHQHRCDHRTQLAQHGGPRWLHGTRTAPECLESGAPVGIATCSSGCLWKGQNWEQAVCERAGRNLAKEGPAPGVL